MINRFAHACKRWLYTNFSLVMICFLILISIFSRSLLSYGYFLACMALILTSRRFFEDTKSQNKQLKLLKYFLLPYLLMDILLQLIYQIPIKAFTSND